MKNHIWHVSIYGDVADDDIWICERCESVARIGSQDRYNIMLGVSGDRTLSCDEIICKKVLDE